MMPVMDGDSLLQAMRLHPELRTTPVIMVTADAVSFQSWRRELHDLSFTLL